MRKMQNIIRKIASFILPVSIVLSALTAPGCASAPAAAREIDARAYGAIPGDGLDDSEALSAAAKAVSDQGGGVLKLGAGNYTANGTIKVYQNVTYRGAGNRATIISCTSGDQPIFQTVNAATGRTQRFTIEEMKIQGHTGITSSILDLTGASYATLRELDIQGNGSSATGTAIGINMPKGLGSFNGYNRMIDVNVTYCTYGWYGDGNDIRFTGGLYNQTTQYGIYATGGANFLIQGVEASGGSVGGIYAAVSGIVIEGCWFETNGTLVSGQYSKNNINTFNSTRVSVRSCRFDNPNPGVIHGTAPMAGQEFGNQISGNGQTGTQNLIANGNFENNDGTTAAPYGWTSTNTATNTWSQLSAGTSFNWTVTTAYTVGQYRFANGNVYVCDTSGTSTGNGNGPSATTADITDGTARWDYVGPATFAAWAGSTAYTGGSLVTNNGNRYICTTAGTSASSGGPTTTGTAISDGTAAWDYIGPDLPSGRYRTAARTTMVSGTGKVAQFFPVTAGDVISAGGWIRRSSGITLGRFGIHAYSGGSISTGSVMSGGNYFEVQSSPAGAWYYYQLKYTVPAGVSQIGIGFASMAGGVGDTIDMCGISAQRGEHLFWDSEAGINSNGGGIWSQNFKIGGKRHGFGTAAPASGTWVVGDIVYNTAPTTGSAIGWRCTTAGTPGTWEAMQYGAIGTANTWAGIQTMSLPPVMSGASITAGTVPDTALGTISTAGKVSDTALSGNIPKKNAANTYTADQTISAASLVFAGVSDGFKLKEGSNARMGVSTLVGGTVTVSNTSVTANTRIYLTRATGGGVRGFLEYTKSAGVSFTINSVDSAGSLVADTSVINWLMIEPSP